MALSSCLQSSRVSDSEGLDFPACSRYSTCLQSKETVPCDTDMQLAKWVPQGVSGMPGSGSLAESFQYGLEGAQQSQGSEGAGEPDLGPGCSLPHPEQPRSYQIHVSGSESNAVCTIKWTHLL